MDHRYIRIIAIIVIGLLGYGIYSFITLSNRYTHLSTEYNTLTETTDAQTRTIDQLERLLDMHAEENADLAQKLRDEKNRNDEFADQISTIAGTVGTLEKLSKTDEELLQKYSKVYFLNEHYVPQELTAIAPEYLYDEQNAQQIHARVYPYLRNMIQDALQDSINLYVKSAYRSFSTQSTLKSNYTVTYGSGANQFSADQGYSEHQLGTTVDFTTTGINGGLDGFNNTAAYEWLTQNAYKYGFVLSYPEHNTYYEFEPWHWRFVGVDLANKLHKDGESFYDLDQRTIDTYLINIFG